MEEEVIKPSYYSIMPANVRYDKELSDKAKLLYGEISCLTNSTGVCVASNDYFSKLYEVHPNTITRNISLLKQKEYIDIESKVYFNNGVRAERREIRLTNKGKEPTIEVKKEKKIKDVEKFEKEFVSIKMTVYKRLCKDYGDEVVNKKIDDMISWCLQKEKFYKDYGKSLATWLQGYPKVKEEIVDEKKKEILKESVNQKPLFDYNEEQEGEDEDCKF